MTIGKLALMFSFGLFFASVCFGAPVQTLAKKKILIVDSYHKEYPWSQETNQGLCAALLKYGYFDNKEQISNFTKHDSIETSTTVINKLWMDTKRRKSAEEMMGMSMTLSELAKKFQPDIILLGDDNAANYIGNEFLGSKIPIVFWGVNNTPIKYGLVDSFEKPGHNVTGVFQTGYYKEGLEFLKKIDPHLSKFAVLADNTPSGRSHLKKIEYLARQGQLPLELVETINTDDFTTWKKRALELQNQVDAFFVAQYSGLKDSANNNVSTKDVAQWYQANITIPEVVVQGQFVKQGMLLAANDGGYNQGYEAGAIAHDILANSASPATYPPRSSPQRGALMVSKQRAEQLGINLADDMGIEQIIGKVTVGQKRIMVVSSYHDGFPWATDTNKGFCDAMLHLGYFDNKEQVDDYNTHHYIETPSVVIKKLWLNSKRNSSKTERAEASLKIYKNIRTFKPDLLFLGDDNAARYVGSKFLDTDIPIVFWGINTTPVKYGLVDNAQKPGHNVTGVYQSGYHLESLRLLKKIIPGLETFAVLSNSSPTGRSHYKKLEYLARRGLLPMTLVDTVSTDDWETWKRRVLELQEKVDAFYVAHYQGLKDDKGNTVPNDTVVVWYMNHVKIPEASVGINVTRGFLCGAFDPGYNQGHQAVEIAHDILTNDINPAIYPPQTPSPGPLTVNRKRAEQLGITLTKKMGIEDYID